MKINFAAFRAVRITKIERWLYYGLSTRRRAALIILYYGLLILLALQFPLIWYLLAGQLVHDLVGLYLLYLRIGKAAKTFAHDNAFAYVAPKGQLWQKPDPEVMARELAAMGDVSLMSYEVIERLNRRTSGLLNNRAFNYIDAEYTYPTLRSVEHKS